MSGGRCFAACAILAASLIGGASNAGEIIAGVASVIDGDSLEVGNQEVRLHGIDAPEWNQLCERGGERYPCGEVASAALAAKINGRHLECDVQDVDRYGRTVAVCHLDGKDVGGWMVREGFALAYRRYSEAYVGDEEAARVASRGVWVGDFVMPWRWRRGERL